uniref:Uncharacterized protein n=1 Tax=Sphaerodactylus townsendi TaxID=933632 RepID=A0ACB8EBT1_9SAUR
MGKLVILIKDNGAPSLSATVTLNLVFAENFQEALPEMSNQSSDLDHQSELQFYLVLALAVISFLFLLTVIFAIMMKIRQSGNPKFLQCIGPDSFPNNGGMFPPNYEEGTLPYSYQLCLSSESRKNELTFLTPTVQIVENVSSNKSSEPSSVGNQLNANVENDDQGYKLSNSSHFSLVLETSDKGKQYAKLVLKRPLDREELASHNLVLTAYNRGDPVKTGTIQLHVVVLDMNDNAPIFSQRTYEVSCREDKPIGTMVIMLKATDLDEGVNKEIKFSFHKISALASQIFHLDSTTGKITLVGNLDFEETPFHEMEVQVQDGGGLLDTATLTIFITDVNDNSPELTLTSVINSIPEDSPAGTSIALLRVQDRDSAENAEVTCSVPGNLPFLLTKSYDKYYSLVTSRTLDREQVAVYNITVTAMDHGTPPLSASIVIPLKILDTNDNPPFFLESIYTSYIMENNPRGTSIFSLKADDPDWEENSQE